MLSIINELSPFFEDCYRRISVREYAKISKISPPTASKLLCSFEKEGILLKEADRRYLFFYANKESKHFIELSRIYWLNRLSEIISYIKSSLNNPTIILFGSLAKAETTPSSDIDIAIIGHKKEMDIVKFEKSLKRKIQLFWFNSLDEIKDKELKRNIINGYILDGRLR